MTLSAQEQYLIELINADRLDPTSAAATYGTGLNVGVTTAMGGPIQSTPMQVLAHNVHLEGAANDQTEFLLEDGQYFGHTGEGGSSITDRVLATDYANPLTFRENLSVIFNPGRNQEALVEDHHENLYNSAPHRAAIFDENQADIGIGLQTGEFRGSNASMLTEVFGAQSGGRYVTGVAYTDTNNNDFYNIGEALSDVSFASTSASTDSAAAGGYALDADGNSTDVTISLDGTELGQVTIDTSDGNAKLDLIADGDGGYALAVSTDTNLTSGIDDATLLGAGNLDLEGHSSANVLTGNSGNNTLRGDGGNDVLNGGGGRDRLHGGSGNDDLNGGGGLDKLYGKSGEDLLVGGGGRDKLYGGSGDDVLRGGGKNDVLSGGGGDDLLKGNSGRDVLRGGAGDDVMHGGGGADRFVFNKGDDEIRDFRDNVDTIEIDDARLGGSDATLDDLMDLGEIIDGNAVFTFEGGHSLTIDGVTDLNVLADDLILV